MKTNPTQETKQARELDFAALVREHKQTIYTVMIYSVIKTIIMHRHLGVNRVMTDDLRTVAHAAKRLKEDYIRALYGGMAMVFCWLVWLCGEILFGHTIYAESSMIARCAVMGTMLVGGAVGFVIGLRMHRRVLNLCDEIIRQVEE